MKTNVPLWSYLTHFFLTWGMFQTNVVGKKHTCYIQELFFFLNLAICENVETYCRAGQATDDSMLMHIACWITKTINTCLKYVILIALPLQQWFYERASMIRYTYIACLVAGTCGLICYCLQIQVLALKVKEL
jgi:hypothetical protein